MRLVKHCAASAAAMMAAGSGALLLVALTASPASAHVVKPVGNYVLTVGWNVEPTYSGQPNAIYLGVKDKSGKAVDDIGEALRVQVSTANQSSAPLQPQLSFDSDTGLGSHGVFLAPIIPTAPGVYTFHFTGAINGQKIDEKFVSSDSTFDNVEDPSTAQFPVKVPTPAELSTNVARLSTRVDDAASKASSADDSASSAKTIGIVALVAAIVLGGGGIVVGLMGRRSSAK
jgi:hypothetical protein